MLTLDAKALTEARGPYTSSERRILIGLAADRERVITRPPRGGFFAIMLAGDAERRRDSSHRIGQLFQPKIVERLISKALLKPASSDISLFVLTESGTAVAGVLASEAESHDKGSH